MLDLYEMFLSDEKEEEKKAPASDKKSAGKKGKKTSEKKYQLPITLNMDGVVHTLEQLEDGKTEATLQEMKGLIEKRWSWYPADISDLDIDEKRGMAFITYRQEGSVKGSIAIGDSDVFQFGQSEMEYTDRIDEESGDVEISNLQSVFKATFPQYFAEDSKSWEKITILRSASTGVIVPLLPIVNANKIPVMDTLTFITAKGIFTFTKEEQLAVIKERIQDAEPDSAPELEIEDIAALMKGKELYFEDRLAVSETGTEGTYSTWIQPKKSEKPEVKEEMYPVKGITLSLYYARYELSPEEFDGKEEVTKGELLAFLVRKNHPEYEYTDVRVNYLKKEKVILITTNGSKKGADVRDMKYFPEDMKQYPEVDGYPDYQTFDNPMFTVKIPRVPLEKCYFSWNIMKIPDYIKAQGAFISRQVYQRFKTEVSLDLYYSTKQGIYFWNPPAQKGTPSGVSTQTEAFLEASYCSGLIKIGQGHSHGRYPAFFSMQDDSDEKMPGIYCVWGSLEEEKTSFCMRAGVGEGLFLSISPDQVFENQQAVSKMSAELLFDLTFRRILGSLREPSYPCIRIGGYDVLIGFNKIHPYVKGVYDTCSGIFLYGLQIGAQGLQISEQCNQDSCGFLISKEKMGQDLLNCPICKVDGNLQVQKTIMEYIEDCMNEA